MFLRKNHLIMIKNNFWEKESLYYDNQSKKFLKCSEKQPVAIYTLTVIMMLATNHLENYTLESPFWLLIILAVTIGEVTGMMFWKIYQYYKQRNDLFIEVDNTENSVQNYLEEGKKLLSTQLKLIIALYILTIIIIRSLYINRNLLNFLGVTVMFFFDYYANKFHVTAEKNKNI